MKNKKVGYSKILKYLGVSLVIPAIQFFVNKKTKKHQEELLVIESIDVIKTSEMFIMASLYLEKEMRYLNKINVFPVPDGDTGSNIFFTLKGVRDVLEDETSSNLEKLSEKIIQASILSSRGNSGTVISHFFQGFCGEFAKVPSLDLPTFIKGMQSGCKETLKAFENPQKGTILDVVQTVNDVCRDYNQKNTDIILFLKKIIEEGNKALENTKYELKKITGYKVVDAGAYGFLCILKGFLHVLENKDSILLHHHEEDDIIITGDHGSKMEFQFCSEFVVSNSRKSVKFWKRTLVEYGDSLQVIGIKDFIKIHIHTNEPKIVQDLCEKHGKIYTKKIDDMKAMCNDKKESDIDKHFSNMRIGTKKDKKVTFIVDSSCNIPADYAKKYSILQLHLKVFDTYNESISLTHTPSDDFYNTMKRQKKFVPKTSQIHKSEFIEAYEKALELSKYVICLPISSKLSGTYQQAIKAQKELKNENIFVFDTLHAGPGILATMNYIYDGISEKKNKDINIFIDNIKRKDIFCETFFIMKNLQYLVKGGRLSLSKYYFAKMLSISPLLTLKNGEIIPHDEKILFSSSKKRKKLFLEKLSYYKKNYSYSNIMMLYTDFTSQKEVESIKKSLDAMNYKIYQLQLMNSIGAHIGPGNIGISIF